MSSLLKVALCALVLAGCSESSEDSPGGGGASSGGGGTSASGGGGPSTGGAGSGGTSAGGGGSAGAGGAAGAAGAGGANACGLTQATGSTLVVNEISSVGDDWVELFNTGGAAVDIGGMVLADFDSGTGCPKTTEALTFPAGTSVAAGAHLLIVADKVGAPSTPQTDCLGATTCFHVGFGISGSAGDQVFLLKGTEIQAHGEIPAGAHAKDESWCRDPDGSGAFVKCKATPGAKNQQL